MSVPSRRFTASPGCFFGNGVYAVNSGNRTEVVTEAGYSYSDGASHFLNGEAAPSAIVKAGDVRYIALPSVDPAKINGAFPNGYSTIVDVTILDTRQGDRRGLALLRGGAVVAQTTIQSGQPIQVKSSPRVYHDFYGKSASGVLAP